MPDWYDETVYWFTAATGGSPYLFVNPVEKIDHSKVYARRNLVPKEVTFDVNGGSEIDSLAVIEGTVIDLDNYITEKENSSFQGWYTKGWTRVEEFEINSRVSGEYTVEDSITFHARWAEASTNIIIELEADSTQLTGDGNVTLTATVSDDYGPLEGIEVVFTVNTGGWSRMENTGSYDSEDYGKAKATFEAKTQNNTRYHGEGTGYKERCFSEH